MAGEVPPFSGPLCDHWMGYHLQGNQKYLPRAGI